MFSSFWEPAGGKATRWSVCPARLIAATSDIQTRVFNIRCGITVLLAKLIRWPARLICLVLYVAPPVKHDLFSGSVRRVAHADDNLVIKPVILRIFFGRVVV